MSVRSDVHERVRVTMSDLTGDEPLLGGAERARQVVSSANRRFSIVSVDHTVSQRIDGWVGASAVVLRRFDEDPESTGDAVIAERRSVSSGSDPSVMALAGVMFGLVGSTPLVDSDENLLATASKADSKNSRITLNDVTSIAPTSLGDDVAWLLVLVAAEPDDAGPQVAVVASVEANDNGGQRLVAATSESLQSLSGPVEMAPIGSYDFGRLAIGHTIGHQAE